MNREELAAAMKAHDWFYDYSDDWDVVKKGRAERDRIMKALDALPFLEAATLWEQIAPKQAGLYARKEKP